MNILALAYMPAAGRSSLDRNLSVISRVRLVGSRTGLTRATSALSATPGKAASLIEADMPVFTLAESLSGRFTTILSLSMTPTLAMAVEVVTVASADDGTVAKKTAVKMGTDVDGEVEIISGLKAGDKVVVEGQDQLSDGKKVEETTRSGE